MCGIALIISGIEIHLSQQQRVCQPSQFSLTTQSLFSEEDIKAALQRRGPDSIGANVVSLQSCSSHDGTNDYVVQSFLHGGEGVKNGSFRELHGELLFIGATLQLRGVSPVVQPLTDALHNVLVYNGEIFGGIHVSDDSSDTEILLQSLGRCCSCLSHDTNRVPCSGRGHESVPELLSRIRGPWALVYWQDSSKTLWFGRDAFGRRSLLVHWPTSDDKRMLISSVLLHSSMQQTDVDVLDVNENFGLNGWEELPCGVYSTSISALRTYGCLIGEVKRHEWTDIELKKLMTWERTSIDPITGNLSVSVQKVPTMQEDILPSLSSEIGFLKSTPTETSHKVLMVLKESVMRRTSLSRIYQGKSSNHVQDKYSPIAVLFSGGLDSMIIAALLHQCIGSEYEIDLLNVSFDGEMAPDRISARTGFKELQKNAPSRRWNLVEIDASLQKLTAETKHVMALINPANTYMDLNIGVALWLASGGDGWLYEESGSSSDLKNKCKYKSKARILLVGSGADEQCAGYGRHRTKFRNKSWLGLHEEMKLDMQRIWKRNLGRDDRCISDNAKEVLQQLDNYTKNSFFHDACVTKCIYFHQARFPFLDEDVIRTLLEIPLWEIANLHLPSGTGDKMILREVARLLGLNNAATQPKRAIQFGSRIARESNRKNFGSNRAANQASAGSAVIHGLSA